MTTKMKKNSIDNKKFLSVEEAASYLDVSKSTIYKLKASGALPYSKPNGGKLYFPKDDLDAWLLENRVNSRRELENEVINKLKSETNEKV